MKYSIWVTRLILCIFLCCSYVVVFAQTHCDMLYERYLDKKKEIKEYRDRHINDANYPPPPNSDPDCKTPYDEQAYSQWERNVFEPEWTMISDLVGLTKDISGQRCTQTNSTNLTDVNPALELISHKCMFYIMKYGNDDYKYYSVVRIALNGLVKLSAFGWSDNDIMWELPKIVERAINRNRERVAVYHEYRATGRNLLQLITKAHVFGNDLDFEDLMRQVAYEPLQFDMEINISATRYQDGSTTDPKFEYKVNAKAHLELDTLVLFTSGNFSWLPTHSTFRFTQRKYTPTDGERMVYTSPDNYNVDWNIVIDPHCPPTAPPGEPVPPNPPEFILTVKNLGPLYENYNTYPANVSDPCPPTNYSTPLMNGGMMKINTFSDCHTECTNCDGIFNTLCIGGLSTLSHDKNKEDMDKMEQDYTHLTMVQMDSIMKNMGKIMEQVQNIGSFKIEDMLQVGNPIAVNKTIETPSSQIAELGAYVKMEIKLTHAPRMRYHPPRRATR